MLYTDSALIISAAKRVVAACEQHGMAVPRLQDILVALVASKLCRNTAANVIKSAAPDIASHIRQLTSSTPELARELQEKSVIGLHILTMAPVSSNATKNGDFMKFCQHMGQPVPNTLTQMMYFTLGSLENNRSHLWHSNLMLHALNMKEENISREVLPLVDEYARELNPERLSESYSQLLSGITFDLSRLDPNLMLEADFPCQRPIRAKEDKQKMIADIYWMHKELKVLKQNTDPTQITQADINDHKRVGRFLKVANSTCPRLELDQNRAKAVALKDKFKRCQLSEADLCANLRQTISDKRIALAFAKEKVDHHRLEAAGQSSVLRWEMPAIQGFTSNLLRKTLAELDSKLVLIEQFKKSTV
jgi:hypothetical protein